ncbi:alpha/beta fold hydrolase [bacterium]|nr:alpha/beta fold hydrolase [bacterium]
MNNYQPERKVKIRKELECAYDIFGSDHSIPVILIMGLGCQMIDWEDDFCFSLASQGFKVIRFDNRDIGHSTHLRGIGTPKLLTLLKNMAAAEPVTVPYQLDDMAEDVILLLDALEIEKAHVVGASMGGMITQLLTIRYEERIASATIIMSTAGNSLNPPPSEEARSVLWTPLPLQKEGFIKQTVLNAGILSGSGYPIDELETAIHAARLFERGLHPAGFVRQYAAILASKNRGESLRSVAVPTLVIHGDEDPLVPVENGIGIAAAIPDSRLEIIKGMGHDLPKEAWPTMIKEISEHIGNSV